VLVVVARIAYDLVATPNELFSLGSLKGS